MNINKKFKINQYNKINHDEIYFLPINSGAKHVKDV